MTATNQNQGLFIFSVIGRFLFLFFTILHGTSNYEGGGG